MRLWSLHPKYLDRAGLIAAWREGLLAKKVLDGQTKGYTRHPQLLRFQECSDTELAIDEYLHVICDEAETRHYAFNRSKLSKRKSCGQIVITDGQLAYEWQHLRTKLQQRAPEAYKFWLAETVCQPHPLFTVKKGGIAPWERLK